MRALENIKDEIIGYVKESDNITLKTKVLDFFIEYEANKDSKTISNYLDFQEVTNFDDVWYLDARLLPSNLISKIFLCKNLRVLDISKSSIKNLAGIEDLQYLQCVFMSENSLKSFQNLIYLENLIFLDLSENSIKKIPDNISKLKNLVFLDISKNSIIKIPQDFEKLYNLNVLKLNYNNIRIIDALFKVKSLQKLELHKNKLKNNISDVSKLSNLKRLLISANDFAYINESVYELTNLVYLMIDHNPITNISISIKKLINLQFLGASFCKLQELPNEIGDLTELKKLRLNHNEIEHLPNSICNLVKLVKINLENNKLCYLPEHIGNLMELQILDVTNNNLKEYPKSLAKLRKLSSLGTNNRLFFSLSQPKEFDISYNNPLDNMPEEVKKFSLVELFDYLEGNKEVYTYYTFWDIPKELKADFQAYLASFPQYVEMIAGKDISENFKTEQVQGGLKLTAITSQEVRIEDFDTYLGEYVTVFLEQSAEQMKADKESNSDYIQVFELDQYIKKLKQINRNLAENLETYKSKAELYKVIAKEKDKRIEDLQIQIRFFQDNFSKRLDIEKSTIDFDKIKFVVETIEEKQKMLLTAPPINGNGFDTNKLLTDLINKAIRLTEGKHTHKIEDLHNNDFVHFLRDNLYYVTDQTQSGIGITGKNFGEIDIMIRNRQNGTPISIIEAFRLASCGEKDTTVSTHLDKLLHNYDTAGLKTNFVIVYAEAKDFVKLWDNYVKYVRNLNNKPEFRGKYPLVIFTDTSTYSPAVGVRVGLALHQREGGTVEVYHIFIDMA